MACKKKRLLEINVVCGVKSTGRIVTDIASEYEADGYEVKIAYGRDNVPSEFSKYAVRIGNDNDVRFHGMVSRLFDAHGFGSRLATARFLKWADSFDPDVLWLHNIHGYYINIELLFDWIKSRPGMEVKWTLHDCWAFTGHCSHYIACGCNKWMTECVSCTQKSEYPASYFCDRSKKNYRRKRALFTGICNMTLIVPSEWLRRQVSKSFLKDYPVEVCNNTIDRKAFKPTCGRLRSIFGLENKKIVLGVASSWTEKKGLYEFFKLRELLDEKYAIVLVGLTRTQIDKLPKGIVGVERTNSKEELAIWYSTADVFLNLSFEENYPTVNLEAEACGTIAVVYDVGGSRETVMCKDNVINVGDIGQVTQKIIDICGDR